MCVDSKRNQIGRTILLFTAGAVVVGLLAASAGAQSFVLSQNGQQVGTANLSVKHDGQWIETSSGAKVDMPGLKYSFNENAVFDGGYRISNVKLNGNVNGSAATVEGKVAGSQFMMTIHANGNTTNTPLTMHRNAVFFPDFDPAALQALLTVGSAAGNRDLWALVPKQTGTVQQVQLAANADMQGTLDGSPVTVHHLTLTYGGDKAEIFSSPRNELLQVEWTDEGFAMVRQGFKLTPPSKPLGAPPTKPADADQNQQTPQGQAQPEPQQQ
jgi:hypothetical protein